MIPLQANAIPFFFLLPIRSGIYYACRFKSPVGVLIDTGTHTQKNQRNCGQWNLDIPMGLLNLQAQQIYETKICNIYVVFQ